MEKEFKYYAFISYNQKDVKWGSRLQRKLENYKMSTTQCRKNKLARNPIKPVFFAPTDIQLNELSDELKARLDVSRNIIVVCSPNSAQSEWVGREIEYFYSLGRKEHIYFFIIDGEPNSDDPKTECYNPVIKRLGLNGRLGANINEKNYRIGLLNRERAYVQLVTTLLGIDFDAIWQRHKRQLFARIATTILLLLTAITAISMAWHANMPVDVTVGLKELTPRNELVPQLSDAEIALHLDDDVRRVRVSSVDEVVVFKDVPRRLLGTNVMLSFTDFPNAPEAGNYYHEEQHAVLSQSMSIDIRRDTSKYGDINACVIDSNGRPRANYPLTIAGCDVVSNEEGYISLHVPFSRQQEFYVVAGDTLHNVGLTSMFAIIVE